MRSLSDPDVCAVMVSFAGKEIKVKSKVEINICDSGIGIKDELLPSIFNPGFTTKERGWGLGLSLAKRIVEDFHNGKIIVNKNRQSQGTCFHILLNKS